MPKHSQLVMEMMAIPGRSGEEAAIMDFIRGKLVEAGVPASASAIDDAHRRSPLGGQVGNLVLKLPGTVRGPRRMLVRPRRHGAHLRRFAPGAKRRPRRQREQGNRPGRRRPRRRRRAADARRWRSCAASCRIRRSRFCGPCRKKSACSARATCDVAKLGKPKLAFNFDGGSPAMLKIGATGGYRMTIDIDGLASHAGNHPEEGVSAIAIASLAIADLVKNGWHGLIEKDGHTGTSNVGVIHGGEATNVVTDHVQLRAEARSHEPKFRERIVKEIRSRVRARRRAGAQHGRQARAASNSTAGSITNRSASRATSRASSRPRRPSRPKGCEPELAVTNGGLDANWLTAHGIPTVTLGCGQRNIHTVAEELDIAEFHLARRIALRLATAAESR